MKLNDEQARALADELDAIAARLEQLDVEAPPPAAASLPRDIGMLQGLAAGIRMQLPRPAAAP